LKYKTKNENISHKKLSYSIKGSPFNKMVYFCGVRHMCIENVKNLDLLLIVIISGSILIGKDSIVVPGLIRERFYFSPKCGRL